VAAGVDELAHSVSFGYFKTLEERFQEFISGADPRRFADLITDGLRAANQSNPSYRPISAEDARLAARRGTVVITTAGLMMRSPEAVRAAFTPVQTANLKLLREHGVALAVGSDNVIDSSVLEFEYLARLGIFDNLTLLKMWAETTPQMIFPKRRIGALKEGCEASFLALEGNPLVDLQNVRKIKMRFKQGFQM
jgi:imidazolonepropionase-like amidohydrolase